tara:strand:+ start:844 stop:1170 length:327 start_codon:yes stop_codon:yes gene_type:complete
MTNATLPEDQVQEEQVENAANQAEGAQEEAQEEQLTETQQAVVTHLGNQFLNNANLAEALSVIPLNHLLQLVQQRVINQATDQVKEMTEEQLQAALQEAEDFQQSLNV